MVFNRWRLRVKDILKSIEKISKITDPITYDEFMENDLIRDSVILNLIIIGEASRNVPEEIRLKTDKVPWSKMIALRNIVVHEYFGISYATIWDTVKINLPLLIQPLNELLENCNEEI